MRDNKKTILIGLGANEPSMVGAPASTIRAALTVLPDYVVQVVRVSRFFHSEAWPDPADPPFVNAVAAVETLLEPAALLACLHDVEARFGRVRHVRNAPRTLDLDLIDYRGLVLTDPDGPQLPHPRAAERAFVLAPLLDVVPGWKHPVTGETGATLLARAEEGGSHAVPIENLG